MFETIPKIRIFINLLLILEICLGLAVIIVAYDEHQKLSAFLAEKESSILTCRFFHAYLLGFQILFSFSCAISMWAIIWPRRYSENVQLLLNVWLVYNFILVACCLANMWLLTTSIEGLEKTTQIILYKGIDIYYLNPDWKLLWDKLQYTKECCGVKSYKDWMEASWMSKDGGHNNDELSINIENMDPYDQLPECNVSYFDNTAYIDADPIKPFMPEHKQILAPYACCKRDSPSCYAHYVPHIKRTSEISPLPHLNLTDINEEGCFYLFTRTLTEAIDILIILILIALIITIILNCVTKYLMATNYRRSYREFTNDLAMFDDEGNALVVVKCPPNVRCITLEEPNTFSGSDIPNLASSTETMNLSQPPNVGDPLDSGYMKKKSNSYFVH